MSNPSARNCSFSRSVREKSFVTAASKFHAPGPRKAFRPVILAGNGPKSEMPFGKPAAALARPGKNAAELAAGRVNTVKLFTLGACCTALLVLATDCGIILLGT